MQKKEFKTTDNFDWVQLFGGEFNPLAVEVNKGEWTAKTLAGLLEGMFFSGMPPSENAGIDEIICLTDDVTNALKALVQHHLPGGSLETKSMKLSFTDAMPGWTGLSTRSFCCYWQISATIEGIEYRQHIAFESPSGPNNAGVTAVKLSTYGNSFYLICDKSTEAESADVE